MPQRVDTATQRVDTATQRDDTANLPAIWADKATLRQPFIPVWTQDQLTLWTAAPVGSTLGPTTMTIVTESGSSNEMTVLPHGRDAGVLDGIVTIACESLWGRMPGRAAIVDRLNSDEDGVFREGKLIVYAADFLHLLGRHNGESERQELRESLARIEGVKVHREGPSGDDYFDDRVLYQHGQLVVRRSDSDHPEALARSSKQPGDPVVLLIRPSETIWAWVNTPGRLRNTDADAYRKVGHGRPLFRWLLGQLQHEDVRRKGLVDVRLDTIDRRLGLGVQDGGEQPWECRRAVAAMLTGLRKGSDLLPSDFDVAGSFDTKSGWRGHVRMRLNLDTDLIPSTDKRHRRLALTSGPSAPGSSRKTIGGTHRREAPIRPVIDGDIWNCDYTVTPTAHKGCRHLGAPSA